MRDFRKGNDIAIRWHATINQGKVKLGDSDIRLILTDKIGNKQSLPFIVQTDDDGKEWLVTAYYGKDHNALGKYRLTLWVNYGKIGEAVKDHCNVFNLVSTTCQIKNNTDSCDNLETDNVITIEDNIAIGVQGDSAYRTWLHLGLDFHGDTSEMGFMLWLREPSDIAAGEVRAKLIELAEKLSEFDRKEEERDDAESLRRQGERDRVKAENLRAEEERKRADAEVNREESERLRKSQFSDLKEEVESTITDEVKRVENAVKRAENAVTQANTATGKVEGLISDANAVKESVENLQKEVEEQLDKMPELSRQVGNLANLQTYNKTTLVDAINEVATKGGSGGGGGNYDDTLVWEELSKKQDKINDLAEIRSGASKGETAVQPAAISDMETKTHASATYQPSGNYATSEQVNQLSLKVTELENRPSSEAYDDTEIRGKLNGLENTLQSEVSSLRDAMDNLPDGQAVSAQVAANTLAIDRMIPKRTNPPYPIWKNSIRVLFVGNSFVLDSLAYLQNIFAESGIDASKVAIYMYWNSNCQLSSYISLYDNNTSIVINRKCGGATMTARGTFKEILSQEWDAVVFAQYSKVSSDWTSFAPYIDKFIRIVRENCTNQNVMIGYQTPWGHTIEDTDSVMNGNREICKRLINEYGVDLIVPCGTAIQNARNTSLNNTGYLTRDSWHLDQGVGQYTAGCCVFQTLISPIFGVSVVGNNSVVTNPSSGNDVTAENRTLCQLAAFHSISDRFNVSPIDESEVVVIESLSINGSDSITDSGSYSVSYTPSNTTQKGVVWSIDSGASYAEINASGLVVAKDGANNSSVTIKATSTANSAIYATKVVSVTKSAAPTLEALTISVDDSGENQKQASVSYTPNDSSFYGVTWSIVSGDEFASIDSASGLITIMASGSVTIKATSTYNSAITAQSTIAVEYVGGEEGGDDDVSFWDTHPLVKGQIQTNEPNLNTSSATDYATFATSIPLADGVYRCVILQDGWKYRWIATPHLSPDNYAPASGARRFTSEIVSNGSNDTTEYVTKYASAAQTDWTINFTYNSYGKKFTLEEVMAAFRIEKVS